jgi:hypothetical protein
MVSFQKNCPSKMGSNIFTLLPPEMADPPRPPPPGKNLGPMYGTRDPKIKTSMFNLQIIISISPMLNYFTFRVIGPLHQENTFKSNN